MAITSSSIGSNTIQISASGLTNTFAEFASAVSDAIIGVSVQFRVTGWSLYDTNTVGIIYTQVFRALNVDGVTYKYIIFRYNTIAQEINTTTCESWSTSTHTATNEAWTFFDCAPIPFNLTNCDLIIYVHPRWCASMAFINNEPSLWAGVFEFAREDVSDTAVNNYPCWGWISSNLWLLGAPRYDLAPLNGVGNGTGQYPLICVPRTVAGDTGVAATYTYSADYGITTYPNVFNDTNAPAFAYYLGSAQSKFTTTGWDNTKKLAMPIKPIKNYKNTNPVNYGKIYGLKILAPIGTVMNKNPITIDSNGNYSNTGTASDHWILNIHHRATSNDANGWLSASGLTTTDYINLGHNVEFLCSIGTALYVTSNNSNKFSKIAYPAYTATALTLPAGTPYDLKFDGERYVYICTSTGLTRLDIRTDTMTSLALTNGCKYLAITPTHICCTMATTSTTPTIYRVLRSTFALDSTVTLTAAQFGNTACLLGDIISGFDGSVFAVNITEASATVKLVKVDSSGTASYLSLSATASSNNVSLTMIDQNTLAIYHQISSTAHTLEYVNPNNMTLTVSAAQLGTAWSGSSLSSGSHITSATGRYFKSYLPKISGVLVLAGRMYSTTYPRLLALGRPSSTPPVNFMGSASYSGTYTYNPTHTAQNWDSVAFVNSTNGSIFFWDGTKMITSNAAVGLRIISGWNGPYVYSSNTTLGQVALPA